jgi:hypothetical protein
MYDMLYGIQNAKDIKLNEISRALCEDIDLIKTENRLSRSLMKLVIILIRKKMFFLKPKHDKRQV